MNIKKQIWKGITYIASAFIILIAGVAVMVSGRSIIINENKKDTKIVITSMEYECTDVETDEWTDGCGGFHQKVTYPLNESGADKAVCFESIIAENKHYEKGDIVTIMYADIAYPNRIPIEDRHIKMLDGDAETITEQAMDIIYQKINNVSIVFIVVIAVITIAVCWALFIDGIRYIKGNNK